MTKTPAQLERDLAQLLLPPEVIKKWRAKVAAYRRAIIRLEAGYSEDLFQGAVRARNALDSAIYDAVGHVAYVPGQPAYASEGIQALERERKELVSSTWEQAQERGREVNYQRSRDQIKRIREEEHEGQSARNRWR